MFTVTTPPDDGENQPGEVVEDSGVVHQTEDEKIRALEFMLATRSEQEKHIRMAHAAQEVAAHPDADPRAQFEEALHEHPELPESHSPA